MAFLGFLSTENLLGVIAFLLGILNFNTQKLKSSINKLNIGLNTVRKYLVTDIRIRNRLEKKADWLIEKMGMDIDKFNIDIENGLNGEYKEILKEIDEDV